MGALGDAGGARVGCSVRAVTGSGGPERRANQPEPAPRLTEFVRSAGYNQIKRPFLRCRYVFFFLYMRWSQDNKMRGLSSMPAYAGKDEDF